MKKEIDARGLACPEPVLLAKKMIEEEGSCVVIVDDASARDNVCRMAESLGCVTAVNESDDAIYVDITGSARHRIADGTLPATGPTVVVFPCDTMGRGDDELGTVLIKAFLHTLFYLSIFSLSAFSFNSFFSYNFFVTFIYPYIIPYLLPYVKCVCVVRVFIPLQPFGSRGLFTLRGGLIL